MAIWGSSSGRARPRRTPLPGFLEDGHRSSDDSVQTTTTEVPISWSYGNGCRRYVLNDADGSIGTASSSALPSLRMEETITARNQRWKGCASISRLTSDLVVTTSALPEESGIMVLSLLSTSNQQQQQQVELDVKSSMTNFSFPVKTGCFVDPENTGYIRIIMVDPLGYILSLRLSMESVHPDPSSLRSYSIPQMLEESSSPLYSHPGATIYAVDFLSPSRIMVALSPFLLCVDLDADEVAPWTEETCISSGFFSTKKIGSILTKAGGLLIGYDGTSDTSSLVPTAALCVVGGESSSHSSKQVVVSLHADGSVRMWSAPSSTSLYPLHVRRIHTAPPTNNEDDSMESFGSIDPPLPDPSTWSTAFDSVSMTGRLYKENDSIYVLAVSVQLDEGAASMDGSACRLSVVHGYADFEDGEQELTLDACMDLTVPEQADGLVDMSFVQQDQRCILQALFRSNEDNIRHSSIMSLTNGNVRSLPVVYPPSRIAILSSEPLARQDEFGLDQAANVEKDSILSLSSSSLSMFQSMGEKEGSLEERIKQMDAMYMKHLFRPTCARGSGVVHAPILHKALTRVIPNYEVPTGTKYQSALPAETLGAIQEWRRLDDRRELPFHKRNATPFRKDVTMMDASETTTVTSPTTTTTLSVYHAFATPGKPSREVTDDEDDAMMMEGDDEGDDAGSLSESGVMRVRQDQMDEQKKIAAHRLRWNRVLLAIWDEEATIRIPLCMAPILSSPGSDLPHDATAEMVVLRAGVTTAVMTCPIHKDNDNNTSRKLDRLSLSILKHIQSDAMRSKMLQKIESQVIDIVSKVSLIVPSSSNMMEHVTRQLCELGAISVSSTRINTPQHDDKKLDDFLTDHNSDDDDDDDQEEDRLATGVEILRLLRSMSSDEIKSWLNASSFRSENGVSQKHAPGLPIACTNIARSGHHSDSHTRASAAYLSLQYLRSEKEFQLGKAILLLGVAKLYDDHAGATKDMERNILCRYMHCVSVLWVCSQSVPATSRLTPSVGNIVTGSSDDTIPLLGSPPPASRARLAGENTSDVGAASTTTVMDARLRTLGTAQGAARSESVVSLATQAIKLAQSFVCQAFDQNDRRTGILPELGVLPYECTSLTSDSFITGGIAPEHARIALRLLVPLMRFRSQADDGIATIRTRKEAAAQCLLIECNQMSKHNILDANKISDLLKIASSLMTPPPEDFIEVMTNEKDLTVSDVNESVFELLKHQGSEDGWHTALFDTYTEEQYGEHLKSFFLKVLLLEQPDNSGVHEITIASEDVVHLCKLQTVKSLFFPWIMESVSSFVTTPGINHGDTLVAIMSSKVSIEYIRTFTKSLLHFSNLNHRSALLERHIGSTGTSPFALRNAPATLNNGLVLSSIRDTIDSIEQSFPRNMYKCMSEYATLWSSFFNHAMAGRVWSSAYDACRGHPNLERKTHNYRRLVMRMCDVGALGDLLHLCATVVPIESTSTDTPDDENVMGMVPKDGKVPQLSAGTDDCVDLYEIAAEILVNASYEQACRGGAYKDDEGGSFTMSPTDYRACLYSLHASRGHWRRAAQAMDMRYEVASNSNTVMPASFSLGLRKQILDDISLSALGASHAMRLVDKPAHRYLMQGELGPYPVPAAFQETDDEAEADESQTRNADNKRDRAGEPAGFKSTSFSSRLTQANASNRFSRFMSQEDLDYRSIRAMNLRALFMDGSSPSSILWALFQSLGEGDNRIIADLASLGYFYRAILLATSAKNSRGTRHPVGRDIFSSTLSNIICSYLAPTVVHCSRPTPGTDGIGSFDDCQESAISKRPTLEQLQMCNHDVGHKTEASPVSFAVAESWRDSNHVSAVARGSMAMTLLRKYTTEYANAENNIALELAESLIDLDKGRVELPAWVIDVLTGAGKEEKGLFAHRKIDGNSKEGTSAANPAALVRLYMKHGIYIAACDLVSMILVGTSSRDMTAPSRLPEKGDIDFVPYDTIDLLWNMIESVLKRVDTKEEDEIELMTSRERMEAALVKHFEWTKISKSGLQSARALSSSF